MSKQQTKFWLVWSFGGRAPTVPHWTKEAAKTEAKRLAGNYPGDVFTVLACVDAYASLIAPVEPVPIVKRPPTEAEKEAEIPF